MNRLITLLLACLSFSVINSCSVIHKQPGRSLRFALQTGANTGGITENTDMNVVPGVKVPEEAAVDAFSGATGTGFNAGMHIIKPIRRVEIETGIDYMYNYQKFNYIDAGNFYIGVRELDISQLIFPLTCNFDILKGLIPGAGLQLKAGVIGQVNLVSVMQTGILPPWSIRILSGGITAGLSSTPLKFENGNGIGLSVDIYRGSQVYEDFYNQPEYEMPGSSFVRLGINYQF